MSVRSGGFEAEKITERVYWVGAIDWRVRNFHGYSTGHGTTYNAYLITGDKNILIDTVRAPFREEMLARISSVTDPGRIDYVISNHSEMDHSGCLPEIISIVKPDKVFASKMGVKALEAHFRIGSLVHAVEDGEGMRLGGADLVFCETRMLHWPDSMVTYLKNERLLFSQDAFGMHLASSERFDDRLPPDLLIQEAGKYYANILMPFAGVVARLPDKLKKNGIDPAIIAPDHGPVWRKRAGEIMSLYPVWAARRAVKKAVVAYDTMWGSTHLMARALAGGINSRGVSVKVLPLGANNRSDVAAELLDAAAFFIGSPTINNGIFPTVADAMSYITGLKPAGLMGAAFGSYGWSGESVKSLTAMLREMKVELISDGIAVTYVPGPAELSACDSLGRAAADKINSSYA